MSRKDLPLRPVGHVVSELRAPDGWIELVPDGV